MFYSSETISCCMSLEDLKSSDTKIAMKNGGRKGMIDGQQKNYTKRSTVALPIFYF